MPSQFNKANFNYFKYINKAFYKNVLNKMLNVYLTYIQQLKYITKKSYKVSYTAIICLFQNKLLVSYKINMASSSNSAHIRSLNFFK